MRKLNYILFGVPIVFFALTFMASAFGEEYTVGLGDPQGTGYGFQELSEYGYYIPINGTMSINHGDSITFTVLDGTAVLSNPWSGGETFLTDNDPSTTHSFTECSSYAFILDYNVDQINVEVDNCPVSDTDMDAAPDYTGDTDVIALQVDLVEITLDLTNALEIIGILQSDLASANNLVADLQSESVLLIQSNVDLQTQLTNSVVDVTPYTDQIDLLADERDQWKQLAENWYAVAMEQLRVMVEVLGL
jgi:hypothetical protein